MISQKNKLIKNDYNKILKGALIASGGAFGTYLLECLPNIDLGQWTVATVAILSIVINALLKLLKETKY